MASWSGLKCWLLEKPEPLAAEEVPETLESSTCSSVEPRPCLPGEQSCASRQPGLALLAGEEPSKPSTG